MQSSTYTIKFVDLPLEVAILNSELCILFDNTGQLILLKNKNQRCVEYAARTHACRMLGPTRLAILAESHTERFKMWVKFQTLKIPKVAISDRDCKTLASPRDQTGDYRVM